MTVYHTFNPYLPAIGRVLQVLQSYGLDGTAIQITKSELARAAQCSASKIPDLLIALESDGRLTWTADRRLVHIQLEDRRSPDGKLIEVAL